jgi:hypothetical protein
MSMATAVGLDITMDARMEMVTAVATAMHMALAMDMAINMEMDKETATGVATAMHTGVDMAKDVRYLIRDYFELLFNNVYDTKS